MVNIDFFGKKEALIMYGLAVSFMVMLHVMHFPERIPTEYLFTTPIWAGSNLGECIGTFSGICVGLYAFISGYGLYAAFSGLEHHSFKQLYSRQWIRLKSFYKLYWFIFILFIPYGLLTGIFKIDLSHFLQCFIGKASRMNHEWWYVWMYVKILLLSPIFFIFITLADKYIKNRDNIKLLLWTIIIILSVYFINTNVYLSLCLLGGVMNRYKFFNLGKYFQAQYRRLTPLVGILLLVAVVLSFIYVYNYWDNTTMKYDIISVPLFIMAILILFRSFNLGGISKVFVVLGKYSVYIWLVHSFFCYYYWQDYMIWPKYSLFIALWTILVSLLVGYCLDKIYKSLNSLFSK